MSLRSEVIRIYNELIAGAKKISELPAAGALTGAELVEGVQGGANVKMTTQAIANLGGGGGGGWAVTGTTNLTGNTEINGGTDKDVLFNAVFDFIVAANGDIVLTPTGELKINGVMGTNIAMAGFKVTGLAAATANGDALRFEDVVGVQDLYIPASAMWPRTTGGCADLTKSELATSLLNIQTLDFDQTTQEFAQFTIVLPRKYNNGTVTAVFYWTAASGSGDVQWGISGGAYSNDDALTVAFGTAQTVDDTLIATNDLHVTSATAAITLAGTPADADFLGFQISRNPASDTLSGDAKLLGVSIRITTDAGKDE